MNNRTRRHYLLGLALAATVACSVQERRQEQVVRQWPAGAIRHLEVDEVSGSVSVIAGPPEQISLVATIQSRGDHKPDGQKENKGYFETEVVGDTLRISREHRRGRRWFFHFGHDDLEIDYELRVPPTIALELQTVNGRIATRGMDSETEVTTVNGPIEVETTGSNELFARTVNGSVRAKFLHSFQGARLKTVNGSVEAILPPTASFSVDLSQVNGDFEAEFPLSIHSHPGSRRVSGEVNGGRHELNIVTVNGDIELGLTSALPPQTPKDPELPAVPAVPAPPAPPALPTT